MIGLTVLASGSSGNVSLVETPSFGLLLDVGLNPRRLKNRLEAIGHSWSSIHAVLLTHTHGDHWNDRSLDQLLQHQIPLFCHPHHHLGLSRFSNAIARLQDANLVRAYQTGSRTTLAPGLSFVPFPVRHDSGAAFGFRIEGPRDLFGDGPSLGYASDLGCWDKTTIEHLIDVDVLAIEFNHDVELQASSGRRPELIARVLGNEGHLSNEQAATLTRAILDRSSPGRLQHVVQLHLSEQCNRPELARESVQTILDEHAPHVRIHTARQHEPLARIDVTQPTPKRRRRSSPRRRTSPPALTQGWLFGPEA